MPSLDFGFRIRRSFIIRLPVNMGSSSSSASLGSVEPIVVSSDTRRLQRSYDARVVEYCVYTTNLGEWKAPLVYMPQHHFAHAHD